MREPLKKLVAATVVAGALVATPGMAQAAQPTTPTAADVDKLVFDAVHSPQVINTLESALTPEQYKFVVEAIHSGK